MLPFPIPAVCHGWALALHWYLLVWNRGIKGTRIFHTAWRIQQKLELSKPWRLWKPLLPLSVRHGRRCRTEGRVAVPGGGGERRQKGRGKGMGWDGRGARLYPIPIYFFSFIKNEKRTGFFYSLIFIFYSTMSSPGLWRINSSIHEEQWDYQQNCRQLDEIPGIIIAAIMGFCVCVWFYSVSM